MLELLKANQIIILLSCGIFSFTLVLYVGMISLPSKKKKKTLMRLEAGSALLMIFDALSYVYRGDTSISGYYMVRISNIFVFIAILLCVYFFNAYITSIFMESDNFKKMPLGLKLGHILPLVGILLVLISQINGMYYYFDEFNVYHRGSLYPVSFILPFATLIIDFIFTIRNRKLAQERILLSIILFTLIPVAAAIFQLFVYGLSLIDFALFLSCGLFYLLALMDMNSELINSANTDYLTRLPNSYGFMSGIKNIRSEYDLTKYNAYFIDVAKMGLINNKYGKENGDKIIQAFANKLKNFIDKEEVVARLGGDQFGAIIKKEKTKNILDLLKGFELSLRLDGKNEKVHISSIVGVYEIYDRRISAGEILNSITIAASHAKNVVKKPYVYMNKSLEKEINDKKLLQEAISVALKNNEFEPFYQPKVDSNTNTLCGAEALVRWKKNGEFVQPFRFIPVMEADETICDLDFLMLENVCKDIQSWIKEGLDVVTVSINFSRKNLANKNLSTLINDTIVKNGIDKKYIQIEVTETNDEYPLKDLKKFIDELHSYDIKVAIDDFGTGSSSLELINVVDFDVLKIDKAFVDNLGDKSLKVLESILYLAKLLKIETIAEGVEENDQCQILNRLGCHNIQGYLFDRPLPKDEFRQRLIRKTY